MINEKYNLHEYPILFQSAMIQANHAGIKTETRRLIKGEPVDIVRMIGQDNLPTGKYGFCAHPSVIEKYIKSPYGEAGDLLWVRETHRWHEDELGTIVQYKAHADDTHTPEVLKSQRWTPSIHMKRKNSRTLLKNIGTSFQRIHDMTPEDALCEGIIKIPHVKDDFYMDYGSFIEWSVTPIFTKSKIFDDLIFRCPLEAYKALWERINGAGSWKTNPFVWVIKYMEIDNV